MGAVLIASGITSRGEQASTCWRMATMCSGVVPQQHPHDVEQAIPCELTQEPGCHLRGFVKPGLAHGVGQARVGVTADKGVSCGRGQL